MDEGADATWLVLLLVGALVCGVLVFFFKPDYRFGPIIESNQDYYPAVPVNPPDNARSITDTVEEMS